VETFNNGRLGLSTPVWLHRSKCVSASLGCWGYGLNASPVCGESTTEGSLQTNAALYRLILPLPDEMHTFSPYDHTNNYRKHITVLPQIGNGWKTTDPQRLRVCADDKQVSFGVKRNGPYRLHILQ